MSKNKRRLDLKITPFLWFDHEAEEAMKFYVSIFKDSRIVSIDRYPGGPLQGPLKEMEGKVLTGIFELEGQQFMAIDGGPDLKPSGAVSFFIDCKNQRQVDYYWDRLTKSGDPRSQRCGWLTDKYGFTWQVVPRVLPKLLNDPDKKKADRVMKVFLKMRKIDIADLKRARDED